MSSRRRLVLSRLLLVLATILTILALLAGWVRGQLLDEQRYVETSVAVLADARVQAATAAYLADQLVAAPALEAALIERLPGRTKAVAGRASTAAERATERAALGALSSRAFQMLWREANAVTFRQLRRAIEDGDRGALVLDLRPLLSKLAAQLGLEGRTVANLPERAGLIRILSAEEVDDVRGATHALQVAATALAIAAVLALLAGMLLSPTRASGIAGAGVAVVVAGAAVLLVRVLVGGALIDGIVTDGSIATAGKRAWWILTDYLATLAGTAILAGVVLLAGGWIVRRRASVVPR